MKQNPMLLTVCLGAFLLGFFISPYIYPRLFGYQNAEECAIHTHTRGAYTACYRLYPSVQDKR